MEDKQKRFFELVERYEQLKSEMKKMREEMAVVMKDIGVGTYLQDHMTGLVYKIVVPTGTYIDFKPIDYARTAKLTESKGSLSKKEAEEAGFVVLKK